MEKLSPQKKAYALHEYATTIRTHRDVMQKVTNGYALCSSVKIEWFNDPEVEQCLQTEYNMSREQLLVRWKEKAEESRQRGSRYFTRPIYLGRRD